MSASDWPTTAGSWERGSKVRVTFGRRQGQTGTIESNTYPYEVTPLVLLDSGEKAIFFSDEIELVIT